MNSRLVGTILVALLLALTDRLSATTPGLEGNYLVLTAKNGRPPPFGSVRLICGPAQGAEATWWQLEVRAEAAFDTLPLFSARALTSGHPWTSLTNRVEFLRYLLRVDGAILDYRNRHTARAVLPGWADFTRHFIPRRAPSSRLQQDVPETCEFLGHGLTLHHARTNAAWEEWPPAKILTLDPELLIGTSRSFKDSEGHRLPQQPQRQNYAYVQFTADDYRVMIETGINLFTVRPDQEQWVRDQPVFYHRSVDGRPPLRYPVDLYRANYLGPVMFMDEPSILMVGDTNIHRTLRYFSDAAVVIEKRTRETYESRGSYGSWLLEKQWLDRGVNLGDLRLQQIDLPSWETLFDTTFYQMRGGGSGLVHEGRYQLPEFDHAVARFTGYERKHTAAELLQYHYAFLRGGTRPFGKHWGTAIYGQCDTNIAPLALTLAYDLGARYLWFWTSDHDHHVPWPEQMTLVRHLRAHERTHPRPSARSAPPKVDVAITIPDGYFLSLENLWWVRVLDKEGRNEASQKYRRLMQRALKAVQTCFDRQQTFDITVDDGRPLKDYAAVIQITDEP